METKLNDNEVREVAGMQRIINNKRNAAQPF